ncbi:MAG: T9SS type A sorting domain-containing protein, partial [Bacteroidia bacterium]
TIYIGTNDGLLVSTNGGASFTVSTVTGLGANEQIFSFAGAKVGSTTRFFCLTADAADIYVGIVGSDYYQFVKGVYSLDYGAGSWMPQMTGIDINNDFLMFVGMAWNDINTVYLGGSNSNGEPEVMKTSNAGAGWTHVFNSTGNLNISTGWCGQGGDRGWGYAECVFGLAVAPGNSSKVIFTDFGFVHTSSNGGTSWQQAYVDAPDQHPANANTPVNQNYHSIGLENTTCWQIHWTSSSDMFACFSDIRGIKSADAGDSWSYNYTGHTSNSMYRIAQHPSNGTLYAAVSGMHDMYQSTRIADIPLDNVDNSGKLIYSTNGGSTWQLLHNFSNHPVFWVALDPNNPNRAYASVIHYTNGSGVGGIYRCDDLQNLGASTWTLLSDPPRTQKHPASITVLNDGKMVCSFSARKTGSSTFTNSSGVFIYDPIGGAWSDVSDAGMQYWTKDLVVDPNDPLQNTWYAGVFSGWGGVANGLGGLYKTTNRGSSWTRINALDRVTSLTFNPVNANEIYMTTETDGLWKSSNINSGTPTFSAVSAYPFRQPERVFFNPSNSNEIWVTSFGNGMWKGTIPATGIADVLPDNSAGLLIYPNPAGGELNIDPQNEKSTVAYLYNSMGQVMQTLDIKGKTTADLRSLPAGVYVIRCENKINRFIKK